MAENNFQKSLNKDKQYYDSYLGLSLVYYKMNDMQNTMKYLKYAISITPSGNPVISKAPNFPASPRGKPPQQLTLPSDDKEQE